MRLEGDLFLDHDLLQTQGEHDHHPRGTVVNVLVNSQAIAGTTAYELRINVGREGYQTVRAILRGHELVDTIGHTGVNVLGGATAGECASSWTKPYGAGGYTTSYMGGYSKLHGASYLSRNNFGSSILLRDVWIDGDEVVLEFYNTSATSQNMSCYGMVVLK